MGQVNIEKIEVIERPKQGKPLSLRVTVTWPIDEAVEDVSFSINTKSDTGETVNSLDLEASDSVMVFQSGVMKNKGLHTVEAIGSNSYETRKFQINAASVIDPPSAGFIPIT